MDKYELAVIVDATLPQEQKEAIIKEACDVVEKCEGKVINSQIWLDKHRFSFRMRNCREGTYFLINFESPKSEVVNIRKVLTLNERIIRFLIVQAE